MAKVLDEVEALIIPPDLEKELKKSPRRMPALQPLAAVIKNAYYSE